MSQRVVTLVNRTDKDFHFTHNGIQYMVKANDDLNVTEDVAYHARKKSIMKYDLETGKAEYQVGIKGVHETGSIGAGKEADAELIDRDTDPAGTPTTINVRGGNAITSDRDALAGEGE